MKRFAFCLLLLTALPLAGLPQDKTAPPPVAEVVVAPPVVPKEPVRGMAGSLIPLTAETKTGAVIWMSKDDELALVPTKDLKNSHRNYATSAVAGTYTVAVFAVKDSSGSEPSYITVVVEPRPTPQPGPGPGPGPGPEPKPTPKVGKLFLVVIEETADAVAKRGAFFTDKALAEFMKTKGHKWRVVDKDVTDASGKPPADVARFIESARGRTLPQLFLVNEQGQTVLSLEMPAAPSLVLELLKKVGGS